MPTMRAKMKVTSVQSNEGEKQYEVLSFAAVSKSDGPYPADGSDENNTYAKFSPSADLKITVANPALFDKFTAGQQFYVDFTEAPAA